MLCNNCAPPYFYILILIRRKNKFSQILPGRWGKQVIKLTQRQISEQHLSDPVYETMETIIMISRLFIFSTIITENNDLHKRFSFQIGYLRKAILPSYFIVDRSRSSVNEKGLILKYWRFKKSVCFIQSNFKKTPQKAERTCQESFPPILT